MPANQALHIASGFLENLAGHSGLDQEEGHTSAPLPGLPHPAVPGQGTTGRAQSSMLSRILATW